MHHALYFITLFKMPSEFKQDLTQITNIRIELQEIVFTKLKVIGYLPDLS